MAKKKILWWMLGSIGILVIVGFLFLAKFISSELDFNSVDQKLFEVIEGRNENTITEAISQGANPNLKIMGRPLLFLGIEEGDIFYIKILVQNGADINIKSKFGRTALHEAALYGQVYIVKFLLENGANVNAKNPRGETPLFYAEEGLIVGPSRTEKHKEVATLLRKYGGTK